MVQRHHLSRARNFLYSGGMYTTLATPALWSPSERGINNVGQIIGHFLTGQKIESKKDARGTKRWLWTDPAPILPGPITR